MHPIVCSTFLGEYLLINRLNRKAIKIPEQLYKYLLKSQTTEPLGAVPGPIVTLLRKVDFELSETIPLFDALLVRSIPKLGFGRASYEITGVCNYRCLHCLLAHRHRAGSPLANRYKLLDLLADAGCLWLQITGGEPTIDRHFIETYRYAYEKGFLISLSTNGSRLSKQEIRNLLAEMPPYRVAISMYGGTPDSFEALTQDTNGYSDFLEGLHTAQELRLNVQINIIRTRYNQHELGHMQQLAESFGFSHHTYSELLPTLSGDSSPIYVMAECEPEKYESNLDNIPQGVDWLERCGAGRLFFHVDCKGDVSICQSARSKKVSLLGNGLDALSSLQQFSEVLLETPAACTTCSLWSHCLNCPPKLALYRNVGQIPDYVCRFQS